MEIKTEIEINASATKVWEILTDFKSYPSWNPFITKISGDLSLGGKLEAFLSPPKGKGMTFKPDVVTLEKNKEFSWLGKFLVKGIFDGKHIFEIEQINSKKVKFIQREEFSGILVPLFKGVINDAKEGFILMNKELKKRAEQ